MLLPPNKLRSATIYYRIIVHPTNPPFTFISIKFSFPAFLPSTIPYAQTCSTHTTLLHNEALELRQALAHPLLKQTLPVRVPAAERRAALREVTRAP